MVIITSSEGKLREFQRQIPGLRKLNLDLPEIQSLDAKAIVRFKIEAALITPTIQTDVMNYNPFIVEDTSLTINGLDGLPGPFIKWFLRAKGPYFLYSLAKGYSPANEAEVKTTIGLCERHRDHPTQITYYEGRVQGKIVRPRGQEDFGWDSVFVPDGHVKTFGEMSPEEKDSCSMRGMAISNLCEYLAQETVPK